MNEKKNRVLYYISFMILMIVLGCSDALRGVFAPVFNTYFNLDGASVSLLITVSYLGNFVFMLFGSKIADRLGVKMVFILGLFIWIGALLIYILTNSYIAIVVGVFFALGSSTLLNTLINISTQRVYINAGFVVNTLFFMQGIGTVASQSIIGRFATGMDIWKFVQDFFEKEIVVSSTGAIISIATAFDIFFNFVFGKAIDIWGYDICMKILPVSMLIATAVFVVMMKVKRN